MKSFRQRLLNAVAAISFVTCLAMAALWIRTYYSSSATLKTWENYAVFIWTGDGGCSFVIRRDYKTNAVGGDAPPWKVSGPNPMLQGINASPFIKRTGFAYSSRPKIIPGWGYQQWDIGISCWWVVVLTSFLPLLRLDASRRRKNRQKDGYCIVCGYDLRATPDRCPECGTLRPKKQIASN
jgi:hypothetical protein